MALVRNGYTDFASFPVTGAIDIIYVDLSNGDEYLWVTSAYVAYNPTKVNVLLGYKDSVWFADNSTFLLGKGQIVYLEQTGTYKLGDGITELQNLSFLGTPSLAENKLLTGGSITIGSYGGSGVNNDIRIAPATWLINPSIYGTIIDTDFLDITLSSSGLQRYIGIYGDNAGVISKVEGIESYYAAYPVTPTNNILIGYILVGDAAVILPPTPPALPTKVVGEQHIITGTTVILNNTPLAGTFAGYIQSQRAGIGVGYYILSVVGNLVTFNEDRTGELFIGDYEY